MALVAERKVSPSCTTTNRLLAAILLRGNFGSSPTKFTATRPLAAASVAHDASKPDGPDNCGLRVSIQRDGER